MSFTHAHYAAADGNKVNRLCDAAEPVAAGLTKGTLNSAVTKWPTAPTSAAVLVFNAGALQWLDPRTTAQAWAEVRAKRDELLQACDWRATKALDRGILESTTWALNPWKTYREALRNLPQTQNDPFNITWPTPPAE